MNLNCHLCTKPLHDQPQRGAFSCDFCGSKHKKGEFRLRCDNPKCDFDLDQSCAQRFAGFNSTFSSQKSQCNKCKYPLINATYTKNTNWSCDKCKGKFNKYSQLRLRCEAHDYDICGGCNAQLQSTFSAPPQQQGFNAPPQQQQGFNAPPQQQQGFNAPPQQQQGFNAPPQQPVNPLNNQTHHKNTKPVIACHKCVSVKLEDASSRSTAWSCDFCGNKHKKGDYRLRCNKHDFDVCLNCTQRFSDFDQSFDSWKHACKTCKHPLVNATYSKNTKWSCDQCKSKYDKYTQLRLRCEKHDYDLCGNCCKTMQHQFNQPGAIVQLNTQFGQVTITSTNNQPQQQQGFNAPPQQQQGFNAPPQQQQGFNAPPQQQQQGFNAPPQQQQQQGFEQVFIGGALHQEQVIRSGQFMSSPSNQYHLFMQHDGNLVLYSDKSFQPQYIVWSTNTANKGQAPHLLKLQGDGNLVIYDRTNTTTWASNTYNVGAMPYKLCIQEDRNICLYDRNNQVTFQTNTTLQQQGFNAPPQQQQGFNAPPQQQQGFNAPPQQQQGFNAPPQQQNPQLVQLEKDQAALNQKKQKLEQEQAKLQRELQALETQNNAENQKLQVELQQLPQKQQVEQQQLKAKQDAEMQQLIAKQEQERQRLSATQQQNYTKLNTTQTQEKTKLEQSHQKIHQQQQIKVSKISTEQQKVQQQLHGIQTEQSVLDQRRKMIPQQQGFNQPPISFQ